eukprot:TCALIF_08581-PB protein Name:"Protein of unknown function" AED:0.35 eAED:0.44 QI:25/0/0.33/1/0.5/0.33/3/0/137
MMRSILALFSVIVHVVTAGKSFITLLDDDVSSQPLCHTEDLLVCQKAQVDVKVFMKNNVITFPPNITMKKTKSSIEKTGTKVIQLRTRSLRICLYNQRHQYWRNPIGMESNFCGTVVSMTAQNSDAAFVVQEQLTGI